MLLPRAAPTSGSRPGPRMSSAITRMMTSSSGPGCSACRAALRPRGPNAGSGRLARCYGSTGRRAAQSRAAVRERRRRGRSVRAVARGRRRGPGDPPRDVDEEPAAAAGRRPARRVAGPSREHRPPRRRPGRRRRAPGTPDPARSRGSRPARPAPWRRRPARRSRRDPSRDPPGDPRVERLGRAPPSRSAVDAQVLELAGARVRRPAQDVGEPVRRARAAARSPPRRGTG